MGAHLGLQGRRRPLPDPRGGPRQGHLATKGRSARNDDQAGEHAGGSGLLLAAALTSAPALLCPRWRGRERDAVVGVKAQPKIAHEDVSLVTPAKALWHAHISLSK